MPYGISFDGKHSYDDFGLWMLTRPDLGSPRAKVSVVDIPGADGSIDLTEANTGEVKYYNRTLTFQFGAVVESDEQEVFRNRIMDALHGRMINQIILDEDTDWYWTGRASVVFSNVRSWRLNCTITVDANPYAMKVAETVVDLRSGSPSIYEVYLAENTSQSDWNSDFRLGTIDFPNGLPLDTLEILNIKWPDDAHVLFSQKQIQVIDADGGVYTRNFTTPQTNNTVSITYTDIIGGGVDLTRVYRIMVSGVGSCTASVSKQSVYYQIENGRKTVVPILSLDASEPVTIILNGVEYTAEVGVYQRDDIMLVGGENILLVPGLGANVTSFTLRFRKGKL